MAGGRLGTRRRARLLALVLLVAASAMIGCGRSARHASPSGSTAAPVPRGVAVTRIGYCGSNGSDQTLDLYRPDPGPSGPVPIVVYFHSGAWVMGDASFAPASLTGRVEAALVGHGWEFASVNYRLAPKYPWPAQIEDAKCAVRFLRANAGVLHVDVNNIGVMGISAGGHLASLIGLAGPAAGFDTGPYPDQSSAAQAVVDDCGPADLTTTDWRSSGAALAFASSVFGEQFGQSDPLLEQASPVSFVAPGAPPFLIQQGLADDTVFPVQAQELAARLRAAGDSVTLELVQNAGHEFVQAGNAPIQPSLSDLALHASSFFETHLGR